MNLTRTIGDLGTSLAASSHAPRWLDRELLFQTIKFKVSFPSSCSEVKRNNIKYSIKSFTSRLLMRVEL